MTAEEHGDHNKSDQQDKGAFRLNAAETKMVSAVAGLVGIACALGPYIHPGASGLPVLGVALAVSVAGGLLVVVAVRMSANRKRKVAILPMTALAMLVGAGVIGCMIGYFALPRQASAAAAPPSQTSRHQISGSGTAGPTRATSPARTLTASSSASRRHTYSEEAYNKHGVPTFRHYQDASGTGATIAFGKVVQISCKIKDLSISSARPGGYWYRIASPPWDNAYYAIANTFLNGDPPGGPYTHNYDSRVRNC